MPQSPSVRSASLFVPRLRLAGLLLALLPAAACVEQRSAEVLEAPAGSALCAQAAEGTSLDLLYAQHLSGSVATGCATSGCHATGAGSLSFTSAQQLWQATVNRPSASDPQQQLVTPGAPEKSLLYLRMLPGAANRMPEGGPYLDDAALRQVASWICAGAPAPGPEAPDAGTGPVLSALTPNEVAVGSGAASLTLDGARFESSSRVELNGALLPSTFVSASRLGASVSAAITGSAAEHRVRVLNPPDGGVSAELLFRVLNPQPTLASVSPGSVSTSGAPFELTLTGSRFNPSSQVLLDGAPVTTTFVSDTRLTGRMPSFSSPGTHRVAVRNPAPGGGTSAELSLAAVVSSLPGITGLQPSPGPADSDFTLTVSGSGYACNPTAKPTVTLNGTELPPPTGCSATQLQVAVPATAAGTHTVQVRNPNGDPSNGASLELVAPNPAPQLAALSPAQALQGSAALTLSATGSSFVPGATLYFNGAPRTTSVQGSGALSATLPAGDLATAGSFPVTVVNPAPGGGASNALTFTVQRPNAVPTVSALTPGGAVIGGPDFTLTVEGQGFVAGATVTFKGTAVQVSSLSATRLAVTVPSALVASAPADGAAPVVVTNPAPGGGAGAPAYFGLATRAVTLSAHVQPIFNASCTTGCHGSPATPVNLTPGRSYGELVGQVSSACGPRLLVKAYGPRRDQSVLIDKVKAHASPACSGAPMPKSGSLSAADLQTLVDWVAQGAPP